MNQSRRKLINSILLFAKETRNLNTTKLSKLLHYFDFEHFKLTGFPSIGLKYHAFECGPVPKNFWLEIKDGIVPSDFKDYLNIYQANNDQEQEYKELRFNAKKSPDMAVFSPREKKILKRLIEIYKNSTARQLSDVSHAVDQPWDKVYNSTAPGAGKNAPIAYELALKQTSGTKRLQAENQIKEFFTVEKQFSISPTR
jgi:uncharacterized phage-associated protein